MKKAARRPPATPAASSPPAAPPPRLAGAEFALLIAFVALVAMTHAGPVGTNDIGFHLRLGEEIASSGPPRVDHHSFTAPGAPYPDHEWLAQLGLWLLYAAGGVPALALAQGGLVAATVALLLWRTAGPAGVRALAVLPVVALAVDHSEIRPHLLGWLYIAVLGLLGERRRFGWMLALLFLWANTHASVLLGVGLAGLVVLEEVARTREPRTLGWAVAVALVPLLNPYGLEVYTLFFTIQGSADFVGEWRPYASSTWQFWLIVGVVAAVMWEMFRSKLNVFDGIRLLVLAVLSFQTSRSGVVMAIFFAPLLGRWWASALPRLGERGRGVLIGAALVGLAASVAVRWREGLGMRLVLDHERLPVAAVDFVQRHRLRGPMFNDYNFGGYFLWKAPEHPVFMDGRIEVYKGRVLDQHLAVSRAAPGWDDIVAAYDIGFFVVRPERGIASTLMADPDWKLVYFDYNAVIFVRSDLSPGLRGLRAVTPFGNVPGAPPALAAEELRYLLAENPDFFGGHKILAFLLYKSGDASGAAVELREYLRLHPTGEALDETQELIRALRKRGVWTE